MDSRSAPGFLPRLVASGAIALFAALLAYRSMSVAIAADRGWTCGSAAWSTDGCWSLGGLPQEGDSVFLTSVDGASRIVTLDVSLPPVTSLKTFLGNVSVDALAGGAMSFRQDANDFSAGYQYVGALGSGTFLHSAGRNSVFSSPAGMLYDISDFVNGGVFLGVQPGSTGTYRLSGSAELASNQTYVGYRGTGVFEQTGGAHSSIEPLFLGYAAGGHGTYTLSDGIVGTSRTFVGRQGVGLFVQSGGQHNATLALNITDPSGASRYELNAGVLNSGDVEIGNGGFVQLAGTHTAAAVLLGASIPGRGTYTMSGGTLTTGSIRVGALGHGVFRQSAAAVVSTDGVVVGDLHGTPSLYELSGAATLTALQENIGMYADGTFNQSAGSNTATREMRLGFATGVVGTYNLTGGTLRVGSDSAADTAVDTMVVGDQSSGIFNHSAGSVRIDGPRAGLDGILTLGRSAGLGTYNLSGTGALFAAEENIGFHNGPFTPGGTGEFNQTGGTHTVRRNLYIGAAVNATGRYTLSGGVLTVGADGQSGRTHVGYASTGTFTQQGGTHSMSGHLFIGEQMQATGTYNLVDGTLLSANVTLANAGTGTFNQSGGVHTVASNMSFGASASGRGTYNLSGGRVESGNLFIASAAGASSTNPGSTGIFNQSGGENVISGSLHVAVGQYSGGTYNLSGGALSASRTYIGMVGDGIFRHSAGTHTLADALFLGSSPGSGTYLLSGSGALSAARISIGDSGSGLFEQSGGSASFSGNIELGKGLNASGQYHLSNGTLTAGKIFVGATSEVANGVGLFSQTGGTNTLTDAVTIAGTTRGAANPSARGTYDLSGGTLTAANVLNFDQLVFSGGQLNAPVTNHAVFSLSGPGTRTVNGHVVNHGTIKVTDTSVEFPLGLEEFGVYASDPSTNLFSDLVVRPSGYLIGGAGDRFVVANDLSIESTQSDAWNTTLATLEFISGADAGHQLLLPGWRLLWGVLRIGAGQHVALAGGTDLAVGSLIVEPGGTLLANGAAVRYAMLDNQGVLDLSNGGAFINAPIPEPHEYLLMLVGLTLVLWRGAWRHRLGIAHTQSATAMARIGDRNLDPAPIILRCLTTRG